MLSNQLWKNSLCCDNMNIPDYLKVPEHSSAKIWGTLEKHNKSWVIDGHPYMISLAKRLFPGSRGNGHGSASFPASKRIVGDLSWFMQRFPLDVKDKKSWLEDLVLFIYADVSVFASAFVISFC